MQALAAARLEPRLATCELGRLDSAELHAGDLRADFRQHLALLARLRARNEIKHAGIETDHAAGTHEIREALFLAHTLEQPRSHAAEQFVDDFADVEILGVHARAGKRLQHDRLLARLVFDVITG